MSTAKKPYVWVKKIDEWQVRCLDPSSGKLNEEVIDLVFISVHIKLSILTHSNVDEWLHRILRHTILVGGLKIFPVAPEGKFCKLAGSDAIELDTGRGYAIFAHGCWCWLPSKKYLKRFANLSTNGESVKNLRFGIHIEELFWQKRLEIIGAMNRRDG
jgi:hypothetical protein